VPLSSGTVETIAPRRSDCHYQENQPPSGTLKQVAQNIHRGVLRAPR
jgi:hypothetical protein